MSPQAISDAVTIAAVLVACAVAALAPRRIARAERWLSRLASHKWQAVMVVGAAAILMRLCLLPIDPPPYPVIHDEFGYLLAADTFAHGRLANPQHPMWAHFETFHVVVTPFYAAKYYPGQGAILAVGKVVFGHPWTGVLLSMGAMCAALCWMLQGWLPARWALVGSTLAFLRFGLVSYWIDSYWGGALTAVGGALVLGALPRTVRAQRVRDAAAMGLGFALLLGTRPYEGCVLGIPVAGILAAWAFARDGVPLRQKVVRGVLPAATIIVAASLLMLLYDRRVTGDPLSIPYQVYESQYCPVPPFFWQHMRPLPAYRHEVMRAFYTGWQAAYYGEKRGSVLGFLHASYLGLEPIGFSLTFATGIPLIAIPWLARERGARVLLLVCLCALLGSELIAFRPQPHYYAPVLGCVFAIVAMGFRRIRALRGRAKRLGPFLVRALVLTAVFLAARDVASVALFPAPERADHMARKRRPTEAALKSLPGPQLAVVRYGTHHLVHDEWVYNDADIDRSKVVWARDMGPRGNEELLRYYGDRTAWLVEPDESPMRLSPYPATATLDRP